ncbi:DMT family transporter [candidate division TA06 bacterium]|uniref:DMT family transporter n=1 Tax=candidate division TA06 bacterium TaxID=2250710 RepID=A0A933IAL6_UNCT6|nr:DMT family transporter [candidate division TA06 bacterium]
MKKVIFIILLALVVIFWGNAFVAIKYLLDQEGLDPMQLTVLRYLPAALLMLAMMFVIYKPQKIFSAWRQEWPGIALYGVTGVLGYNLALNYGESKIAAGTASLIVGLSPTLTLIASNLALKEKITAKKLGGIITAFIGLFIVVRWGAGEAINFNYLLGVLITFGAPLSWAIYTIVGKPMVHRHDPNLITMSAVIWGSLPLFFLMPPIKTMAAISPKGWGALLFLSLICTIFGFLVWSWALKKTEAARLGALVYLIPLVTIISGLIFLKEAPTPGLIAGGLVLITGVVAAET